MSASLIGGSGSSAFKLSMSLAGSCFSPESAPFHHGIRRQGGTIFRATLPTAVGRSKRTRGRGAHCSGCGCWRVPYIKNMSEHKVTLKWERGGAEFSYQKYPRDHTWSFDSGHTMTATAAPAYLGNPAHVDPEEAFVASLSSCQCSPS